MAQQQPNQPPEYLDDNGEPVYLNDDGEEEQGLIGKLWNKVTSPLVNKPASLEQAEESFSQDHPIIGGIGKFATDVMYGLTSPLNVGLTATSAGVPIAAKAGLETLSKGLRFGTKALSAPVAAEGAYHLGTAENIPEAVGGGIELAGGLYGMKSSINKPKLPIKTAAKEVAGDIALPTNQVKQAELPIDFQPEITPVDKLKTALDTSVPLNRKQARDISVERAKRVGEAEGVTTKGQTGFRERLGKFAGEYSKVEIEPIKLEQPDVDSIFDLIENSQLKRFQKVNAGTGLSKLLNGQVPGSYEIQQMEKALGTKINVPVGTGKSLIREVVSFPIAAQTGGDFSFALRQGLPLIHKPEYWKSLPNLYRAWGSQKFTEGVRRKIQSNKWYDSANEAGLEITDFANKREENMVATFMDKYVPGWHRFNRGNWAFINQLRMDAYANLMDKAPMMGQDLKADLVQSKLLAKTINNLTGRGSTPERYSGFLADTMFAPKFQSSILQRMDPRNYISKPPQVRKEYWKSLAATSAAWGTMAQLANFAGADVSLDPNNSDFMKIKWGNTRQEPSGGLQKYMVLLSRLASGKYVSSTTGNESEYGESFGSRARFDSLIDFATNLVGPVLGYGIKAARATEYRPFRVLDEAARLFIQFGIQDVYEVSQENPELIPIVLPANILGMGSQTYGDRGQDSRIVPEDFDIDFKGGSLTGE